MCPAREPVKSPRRYDSTARQQAAQRRRQAVLDAAQDLFLRTGYVATTVPLTADAAGVSAETVYKAYGGKAGLVRALLERALAGAGAVPAERRSDVLSGQAADPVALLRGWASLATEVAPRVAPILLLVRAAAATDAEMATLQKELTRQQLTRMTRNARRLVVLPGVRDGLTVPRIRDVLVAYLTPELFEVLVLRQRWTVEEYGEFLLRGYVAELVGVPRPD